ncbi:hypothetical protein BDZ97DRAFT_1779685 [Flammula alnicola]|nr:hypothetical protein BDZ97DRAFT_1779685 [Flammula alnicola]
MIILDGKTDGGTKNDSFEAAFTRSSSPLPDYHTSEALHWKSIASPPKRPKVDPRIWKQLYSLSLSINQKPEPPPNLFDLDFSNSFWDDIEDANPPALLQLSTSGAISMNRDAKETSVLFSVVMTYSSMDVRRQTNICFSSTGMNRGLSIYVPQHLGVNDALALDIVVLLPQVTATVDNFVTYLPMLSQDFGDLGPHLSFNQLTLEGAACPITCKSLHASQISVKNLAALIEGTFNVTCGLTLDTVKGCSVVSNITLTQPLFPTRPTILNIDTGDSMINANVLLNSPQLSVPESSHPPAFAALIKNFNGPLNLSIAHQQNCTFSAQTKMDQVTVKGSWPSPQNDPTGAHRPWTLDLDQNTSSLASGWTGWGPRPMRNVVQSDVNIISALSPVLLQFGPS